MNDVARLDAHLVERRPGDAAPPSVSIGTFVKVSIRDERFWCRVRDVRRDGTLSALVDNDLWRSPWKQGDVIRLQMCHVLETSEPEDAVVFGALAASLGSLEEAAAVWHDMRRDGGDAAVGKPNTLFLIPHMA